MTLNRIRNFFRIFFTEMSTSENVLLTPVGVRYMKSLDRDKFLRKLQVPILKLTEENLSDIRRVSKPYWLKVNNFKPIQNFQSPCSDKFTKCIFLNPEKVGQWTDISDTDRQMLQKYGVDEINFDTKEVQLGYDNWTSNIILKAVLPEDYESITGFSQIGHIIHLNLKDHFMDYRSLIGKVFLDKIKSCRTVVNKSATISESFRNFSMEVIAGEEDLMVTAKENNVSFQLDFSKVYWNPRLGKEHERIVNLLKPKDVLFDVFCGVGPFAIPAAKKGVRVFANDLNPESYKWLNHNAKLNKINKTLLKTYNEDGKNFICGTFKDFLVKYCKGDEKLENDTKIHITMNLPAMAFNFLKYFKGLIPEEELAKKLNNNIVVYLYCFATVNDPKECAKEMVNEGFGMDMSSYIEDVFYVRNVAPRKEMMRVTIVLPKEVLLFKSDDVSEPPQKKLCVEN